MCDDFFFAVNLREKNFLHEVTIYHRKKTKGYFGIDKDNTCSNENLVWDFWVICSLTRNKKSHICLCRQYRHQQQVLYSGLKSTYFF